VQFLPVRCYASAGICYGISICVSVCQSVCVSHACFVSKRLNYYYYIHLTAFFQAVPFFQNNLGKPAPEKQYHSAKTNLDLLKQEIVSGSGIS